MWNIVGNIIYAIMLVLAYGGAVLGVFCLIDAASRRADAFVATDKQTKKTWVGITIGATVVLGLGALAPGAGMVGPLGIFWLAAMVGVLVYLADVRPRIKEITRPSGW